MTVYFAPAGEPFDGDNWQELGEISEIEVEILPDLDGARQSLKAAAERVARPIPTGCVLEGTFEPSPELRRYFEELEKLDETTKEWLTRPAPMSSIPKNQMAVLQDGINRLAFYVDTARKHYVLPQILERGTP